MTSSPDADALSSNPMEGMSLEECEQRLHNPTLSPDERKQLLHQRSRQLMRTGRYAEAIATLDELLAIADPASAQVWVERGDAQRSLRSFKDALHSYRQALRLEPNHCRALNGCCYCLSMLNRHDEALPLSDQAIALHGNAPESWSVRGVIFSMKREPQMALEHYDHALSLQPDYERAWYNRGIALLQLGRDAEALDHIDRSLELSSNHHEPWYAMAYAYRAFILLRQGRFAAVVESCDRALSLNPTLYPAALYRLIALVMTGAIFQHLASGSKRRSLFHSVGVIFNQLKVWLVAIAAVLIGLHYGQDVEWLKRGVSIAASLGILTLLVTELWMNRAKLSFVWRTYLRSGPLTYVRAVGILVTTLTTYALADSVAPPFLRWGWANLVFGQPGNILFQPFTIFESRSLQSLPVLMASLFSGMVHWAIALPSMNLAGQFDWRDAFMVGFWALLLLLIPFWARLEEHIFRRGAHTWRQISVRSVQFGLLHLLAGIPILGGFVLIVPGFLFACRYKYVYERQLRRSQDAAQAIEAGVQASTADHAVYNAILVTLVMLTLTIL